MITHFFQLGHNQQQAFNQVWQHFNFPSIPDKTLDEWFERFFKDEHFLGKDDCYELVKMVAQKNLHYKNAIFCDKLWNESYTYSEANSRYGFQFGVKEKELFVLDRFQGQERLVILK